MFSHALAIVCICPTTWIIHSAAKLPALRDSATRVCRDLEFGNSQFQQFVADHPNTAPVFKNNPDLQWMLIWHFAGGLEGNKRYWENKESIPHSGGHLPSISGYPVVRIKQNASAIDKCATLLFELLNRKVDGEYDLLINSPTDKRKSRRAFVDTCLRKEYEASRQVQWFFLTHPIQGASPKLDPYYYNFVSWQYGFPEYILFVDVQYNKRYHPRTFYGMIHEYILRNQKTLLRHRSDNKQQS